MEKTLNKIGLDGKWAKQFKQEELFVQIHIEEPPIEPLANEKLDSEISNDTPVEKLETKKTRCEEFPEETKEEKEDSNKKEEIIIFCPVIKADKHNTYRSANWL